MFSHKLIATRCPPHSEILLLTLFFPDMTMTWHNPLTWLESKVDLSRKLYCANPQCEYPVIHSDIIAYHRDEKEIYHLGECQLLGVAWKSWNTRGITMGTFERITRNEALRLLQKGHIQQPSLEDRVE